MIVGNLAKIRKIVKTRNWEMYFENPTEDYFNINKTEVKLILGDKKGDYLRHVPDNYGPKDTVGYAILRGYNCQGRCHYCYLQTYFKSPDIVKFQNIEDIVCFLKKFLDKFRQKYPSKKVILYDGDFQDSFGFAFLKDNLFQLNRILELISQYENVFLEIRTKQIIDNFSVYDFLFKKEFIKFLIVAITFSPKEIIENFEWGTSDLNTRVNFAKYVQNKGFKIGVRIDPVILFYENIDKSIALYKDFIKFLKATLDKEFIYNWGIGILRIKKNLYKKLKENNSKLVKNLTYENGFYRYPSNVRYKIYKEILDTIGKDTYICMDDF